MQQKEITIKHILTYGKHGAMGILTGTGVGLFFSYVIIGFILSINSQILMNSFVLVRPLQPAVSVYIFIFAVYGAYIGYIFEGKEKAIHLSRLGAIAGVLCGIAEASYVEWTRISGEIGQLSFFPIILAATGLIFGVPKIKNMILLAISGALGGMVGYGIYLLSLNLSYYLIYLKAGLSVVIVAILLSVLAIMIPGAFISIGMYFSERTTSLPGEVPRFLRITRNVGIILIIILLLVSTLFSLGMSNYGSTSSSIQVSSDINEFIIYVPIFLDDKGNALNMYDMPAAKGTATTTIIDTEHGKALKIRGFGRIELNMNQTHVRFIIKDSQNFFDRLKLSMSNYVRSEALAGRQIDAWVYSETEGAMFNYYIKQDSGGGRIMDIHTEKTERLSKGWQVIKLLGTGIWYD